MLRLRVQLRSVVKKAKVVGFDGNNNPLVNIIGSSGERTSVTTANDINKSSLSFGEVVDLEGENNTGWVITATTKSTQQKQSLPPMTRREAEARYKQVVRGANNVGMYAWVSRRVRFAEQNDKKSSNR